MRIVLCASGRFAVPTLGALTRGGEELVGIVTQPARPAGRGGKMRVTPIAEAAAAAGLGAWECPDVNAPEAVERIRQMRPDIVVVCDFGQMIRKAVRDCAAIDTFNLHGSLLPELRGAAPVNWAIIRGYTGTGVTTFCLVDKLDAGDVYLNARTEIGPRETAEELRGRLAEIGAKVVLDTVALLGRQGRGGRPQDESKATLAPKLQKSDGLIDWSADAPAVRNRVHGTWPWPGGQAVFRGRQHPSVEVSIARCAAEDAPAPLPPGTVDRDLCVAAGKGRLRILEIKPSGKRLMTWRDFVNGFRVVEGDAFVRPASQ